MDIIKRAQELKKKQEEQEKVMAEARKQKRIEEKRAEDKVEQDRIIGKKRITQFIQLMTSKNATKDRVYYYEYGPYGSYDQWPKRKKLIGEGWIIKSPYNYTEPYADYSSKIPGTFLLCNGQLCIFDNLHQRGGFFSSEMDFLGGKFGQSRDSNIFAGDDINDILAEVVIRYGLV